MSLVSMRQLLDHASEHGYGHPAFNVTTIESVHAVFGAARKLNAPVIMQFSSGARKYDHDAFVKGLIESVSREYNDITFAVHQDHGSSIGVCVGAIQNGFSSVMIDGSLMPDGKTPASHEYNMEISREMVKIAHSVGVSVEGELGIIGSLETLTADKEDGHGAEGKLTREDLLTNPEEAKTFVEVTGVDALAVAVGTSHGAFKFTRKPDGDILAVDRIAEIHKQIPNTALVMHGASSVPQEIQDEFNEFGGKIPQTFGVPLEEIKRAIKFGIRKVNIDTDLRMASTAAVRRVLMQNPAEFDPRKLGQASIDAMQKIVEIRMTEFGSAGNNDKIKPVPLSDMVKYYKK